MKNPLLIALTVAISLASCGDIRDRNITTPPPNFNVSLIPKEDNGCDCNLGERYVVKNFGGHGSFSLQTMTRDLADTSPIPGTIISPTLKQNEIYQLECTVQPSDSKQCTKKVISVVNSMPYGGTLDVQSADVVLAFAKADIQNMTKLGSATGDCVKNCTVSGDCIKIDASKAKDEVGKSIALLMGKFHSTIPNKHIREMTSSKINVCLRSDIVFEGITAYNFGYAANCIASAMLPKKMGNLDIVIPRTITFDHAVEANGNFNLHFKYVQGTPTLVFSDTSLNNIIGGRLLSSKYIFGVYILDIYRGADQNPTNACLAVAII